MCWHGLRTKFSMALSTSLVLFLCRTYCKKLLVVCKVFKIGTNESIGVMRGAMAISGEMYSTPRTISVVWLLVHLWSDISSRVGWYWQEARSKQEIATCFNPFPEQLYKHRALILLSNGYDLQLQVTLWCIFIITPNL